MTETVKSEPVELDAFVARDVETIKVLADPLRMRVLLETSETERTVKELASILDVPQTRLYYHVRMLERHGMLRITARRMVSGIEERRYTAAATSWTIAPELLSDPAVSGLLDGLFALTQSQLEVALSHATAGPGEPDSSVPVLNFGRLFVTTEEIAEIRQRLDNVLQWIASDRRRATPGPDRIEYGSFLGVYRVQAPRADERTAQDRDAS